MMPPRLEQDSDDLYNRSYLASFSSVIIILLTFFIYFNSIATRHPERSEQVRRSVKAEFVSGQRTAQQEPEKDLLELFAAKVLTPLSLQPVRAGGALVTRVAAKRMFFNGEYELSADFTPLLNALAHAAKSDRCRVHIDVFAKHAPETWETALRRVGALTRFFADAQLESAAVVARWTDPAPGPDDAPDHIRVALSGCPAPTRTGETP